MSIDYELANKLKDAGFPQEEKFEKIIALGTAQAYLRQSKPDDALLEKYEKALEDLRELYKDDEEVVYLPTLSELIEACGDDFAHLSLSIIDRRWYANARNGAEGEGTSPVEALALLYLALNEKKVVD